MVSRNEMANKKILNEGSLTVGFDTEITKELLLEGIARDIIRGIQNLRKEQELDVSDRINLIIAGDEQVQEAVSEFKDYITKETLSDSLTLAESASHEVSCGDTSAGITVTKA